MLLTLTPWPSGTMRWRWLWWLPSAWYHYCNFTQVLMLITNTLSVWRQSRRLGAFSPKPILPCSCHQSEHFSGAWGDLCFFCSIFKIFTQSWQVRKVTFFPARQPLCEVPCERDQRAHNWPGGLHHPTHQVHLQFWKGRGDSWQKNIYFQINVVRSFSWTK